MIIQVAFLGLVLAFHKTAFKYDWNPKIDLWGNVFIIGLMLFVNFVVNYFVKLKILTGFFLGGIHFSLCMKIFSFGHVMYEVHKVIQDLNKKSDKKQFASEDLSAEVC